MNHRFYKYFIRNMSLLAPALGVAGSMIVLGTFFLRDFAASSSSLSILTGILASFLGAAVAYAFARAYKLALHRQPAVFISYSHKDSDFVDLLASALVEMDVEPIVDKLELKVGDDIRAAVDEMIDRSEYFLYVISKNSAGSDWSRKEIDQALKHDKRILPVVLDAEAIPEPLSGVYYADFSGKFEDGLLQLKKTFERNKG